MRASILYVSAFVAAVSAAPGYNALKALVPKQLPSPTVCGLSNAQQPVLSPSPTVSPYAAPTGLTLAVVAIGKGTQNYTCADSTAASVPVAAGAVANLYDASCMAAYLPPAQFEQVPVMANSPAAGIVLSHLPTIGQHFFTTSTTPAFNVNSLGFTELKKTGSEPSTTAGSVAWLQLTVQAAGTTSQVKSVYRLATAGGSAPANCLNQQPNIEVPYAAQYWFYT